MVPISLTSYDGLASSSTLVVSRSVTIASPLGRNPMPHGAASPVAIVSTTFGGVVSLVGVSLDGSALDGLSDGVLSDCGVAVTVVPGSSLPSSLQAVSPAAVRAAALARAARRLMPEP